MFEKVFSHYHNRKGLPAKSTGQAMLKVRDYARDRRPGRSRNTNSGLPWETLMFADQPAK